MPLVLTSRTPWRQSPSGICVPNSGSEQYRGIIAAYPLTPQMPHDIVRGRSVSLVAAPTYAAFGPGTSLALTTNGTSQAASSAVDLSGSPHILLSFWMYWDAYATNDDLAFEYTNNSNNKNGFIVNPNTSGGAGVEFTMSGTSSKYWVFRFTDPSAAVWHHYLLRMDRTVPVSQVWVDGVEQSYLSGLRNLSAGTSFDNSTLYFMSRGAASLFGAGRLADVRLYDGASSLPPSALAKSLYDPATCWELYAPRVRRVYLDVGGGTPSSFKAAWVRHGYRGLGTGVR